MLKWIKLEYAILRDARIKRLMHDHGMKGFGTYIALRIEVTSVNICPLTVGDLFSIFQRDVSRELMQKVICDYDLFRVDEKNQVFLRLKEDPSPAPASGGLRPQIEASPRPSPKGKGVEASSPPLLKEGSCFAQEKKRKENIKKNGDGGDGILNKNNKNPAWEVDAAHLDAPLSARESEQALFADQPSSHQTQESLNLPAVKNRRLSEAQKPRLNGTTNENDDIDDTLRYDTALPTIRKASLATITRYYYGIP